MQYKQITQFEFEFGVWKKSWISIINKYNVIDTESLLKYERSKWVTWFFLWKAVCFLSFLTRFDIQSISLSFLLNFLFLVAIIPSTASPKLALFESYKTLYSIINSDYVRFTFRLYNNLSLPNGNWINKRKYLSKRIRADNIVNTSPWSIKNTTICMRLLNF